MRRVPAAVAVLTVDHDGDRLGLTVGSLVSLSLEPPMVGVSISKHSPMHELLRGAGAFGLSVLSGRQEQLARHFAMSGMPPVARWEGIALREGETGAPLLADAVGWIECRLRGEFDARTHTFFAGEVVALARGGEPDALVYIRQGYAAL